MKELTMAPRPAMSLLCAIGLLCIAKGYTQDVRLDMTDARRSWFKPELIENHDSVCPAVLAAARETFVSAEPLTRGDRGGRLQIGPLEYVPLDSLPAESYIELSGQKVYVRNETFPGCGGGCETATLNVSDEPLPANFDAGAKAGGHLARTPGALEWPLYRDAQGNYFTLAEVSGALQVYRIVQPQTWHLSCAVSIAPGELWESADQDVKTVALSIQELRRATGAIAEDAGDCGSLRTAGRLRGYLQDAMNQVVYRPWALSGAGEPPDFGDWALQGVAEYRALAAFKSQFARTTQDVAAFYVRKNGWTPEAAHEMARQALGGAVSAGFSFGTSDEVNQSELQLRAALLAHRPLAEIRAMIADASALNGGIRDSVLNVAIEYPEALRFLIEQGVDVDQANAFGKTPLMYAAQFNTLEAVRLLLEHGANPNASTVQPNDRCNYTLEQSSVTPLHYAARYASGAVIRMLVEHGAVTFSEASDAKGGTYPVDWLRYYTGSQSEERNPNIAPEEVAALAEILSVPDEAKRKEMSVQLTTLAESEYAKGKQQNAYRALKSALQADIKNQRARGNLALVALRTGRLGEAAEAASVTLQEDASPAGRASARFNMGLVCAQYGQGYLDYNGAYYCKESPLHDFLQAWKIEPTAARRTKVKQTFLTADARQPSKGTDCDISLQDGTKQRYRFGFADDSGGSRSNPRQRIYVYHPSRQTIDPASIHWDVTLYVNGARTPTTTSPRVTERYDLGSFAVTELEGEHPIQGPVTVGSQRCEDPRKS
jgi:hypothetical protein